MSDNKPEKSNALRNLSIFLIVVLLFACLGLSAIGNGSSRGSTGSSSSNNRPSSVTNRPTATPVTFDPIRLNGRGDDVVRLAKPNVPAIVRLVHQGSSNFVVINYDDNGNRIHLLVNEIGSYAGIRPLDFSDGEQTSRLEIQADGSWTVEVKPLSAAQRVSVPTTSLGGSGDTVLLLTGSSPDTATISHNGSSNFVVMAYGSSRRLLVNEIGRYNGTVVVPRGTAVLEVIADGDWQMAITGR